MSENIPEDFMTVDEKTGDENEIRKNVYLKK